MAGKRVSQGEATATQEKKTGRSVKQDRKKLWIALAAVAAVLVVCMVGLCIYANSYNGVFPGVSMGGEELSGLSKSELADVLTPDSLLQGTVKVTADGKELGSYTQKELGARIDQTALIDETWNVGRSSGWFGSGWAMLRGWMGKKTPLSLSVDDYDQAELGKAISDMAGKFDVEPVDGSYELDGEKLRATTPVDGRSLDQAGLKEALTALGGAAGEVEAPWDAVSGKALDVAAISEELSAEPSAARYDIATGKVVDGQVGVSIDKEAAAKALASAAPGETVELPAEIIYPKMTAKELEAVLFRDVLGTATTTVSGTASRKGNVKLSGQSVNGTILNDGDVFDHNQVVGQRTTARGYGAAPSYVNGLTVDTVGGGICQTSSTIYLAALRSNLEIVTRSNHRYISSYIDPGLDATVSWGGPEFRFRNNSGYPIRIDVTYANSKITVTIRGTNTTGNYVQMTYKHLSTTGYETVYEETSALPAGVQQQKQSGYVGYKYETYRNLYSKDGKLISSKLEAVSTYSSRNRIVLVGTGAPAPDTGTGGETGTGGGTGTGTGGETDTGTGGDTGTGTGGETDTGTGGETDTGTGGGTDTGTGGETDTGTGGETDTGTGGETDTGTGGETDTGTGSETA